MAAYRKGSYFNSRFDKNIRAHLIPVKVTHGAIQNYGFIFERSDTGYGRNEETLDYGVQDQGLEIGGNEDSQGYEQEQVEMKGYEGYGNAADQEETPIAEQENQGYNVDEEIHDHHNVGETNNEEVHEESFGYGGDQESDSYGHEDSHDVDYFSHPAYKYDYGVKDSKTGDHKTHWEHRDGDKVTGEYTVDEADGTKRIVSYTSDKKNGFQAIVKKIGTPYYPDHHTSHKEEKKDH